MNARSFASDNNSGAHPRVLQAVTQANTGHAVGYGDDPWTAQALDALKQTFGPDSAAFFVFLGTAANVLSLSALARPHHGVVCAHTAHINVDECGAPERVGGFKLLQAPHRDGKISPADVLPRLRDLGNEHHSQPRVISITQCTELGQVYTLEEVRALADLAHAHGLFLHMDGARLANAAAALGVGLREATQGCGVDVLSFGGTKNGLMFGEAVVFFTGRLPGDVVAEFRYLRKQTMQLASKMRFIGAQFSALLADGLWLDNARHSNAMAALLAREAGSVPGVELTRPTVTNAVFAKIPHQAAQALLNDWFFYTWDASDPDWPEVRWMCSFDTTEEDVMAFCADLRRVMGRVMG